MAAKKLSNTFVWILMGLLILGLGGFGVTNLSGNARSIGQVGDSDIDVNEYFRALQTEIRAQEATRGEALSFLQAQELGVVDNVLARLVSVAALDDETKRLGISIGDENLRDEIVQIPQFQGIDGEFDRVAYEGALEQIGLNEARFEEQMRDETARTLLQAAVLGGVNAPDTYTDSVLKFIGEKRNVTWATLDRSNLTTGVPVPSENDLVTFHEENAPLFTAPETKRITYVQLSPEMIIDTVEVDETLLREAYEDRAEQYNQPERRLVERLAYPDQGAADAAYTKLSNGEATFEDLVAERGLELIDIDLGDVSQLDLGSAGTAVFAASAGDVTHPVYTDLGPALFRVNAVLTAQQTSFEDALPELREELAIDRARRVIDSQIDSIDDLLAGGASLEDLAQETDVELGQIDWHPFVAEGIGAFENFRTAAAEVTDSDYPEVLQLQDGGIFALRLDEVVPPALQPLDDVRDQVETAWTNVAIVNELEKQLETDLPRLRDGATFEEIGLTPRLAENLTRTSFEPETPAEFNQTAFGMQQGDVNTLNSNGQIFILRLDTITPPDDDDPALAQIKPAIQNQYANGLSQDLFQLMADDIRSRVGIELNQQVLNAVHANFQ
ncbi:Peptidyl-prolyl cis-trans isomerase D [Roseovarius albus]|uniref:Peptidyl-prolyl cis-trans isomerase D n=1 Tax=Roseovarius albus TaxID=1247867 RepID=A0A1X6Z1I9_9RHOB|nr:peptidyl-prolyl cis-trans isomerase [Roseovarius albus]SLN37666.1 Peptidyl-prolyl cis-trans isomerase D [Roseovarius albus]